MEKYISLPLKEEDIRSLKAGDMVFLSGELYTARDAAHKRIYEAIQSNQNLKIPLDGITLYYMGPSPARPGKVIGSAGPTTASRMDKYTPTLLDLGLKGMIGKGKRSLDVKQAMIKNKAVYFAAIGGAGALLSRAIKSAVIVEYEDLGTEVDKIYVVLKKYEAETRQSNMNLEQMAKANVETYETLEKYIVAGELAKEEVDKYIAEYEVKAQNPDDQKAALIYQSLLQARDMLDQRIYDLRISENVAMQTIPMIQMIQLGNYNLIRKINSAFLITLPIFKQCLTQAIMLKRQELQARSMQVLDDKTNELLIRNANSVSKNAATLAKMAGTSSIKIETIEETWRTITNGISETKKIQETNKNDREKNTIKLEEFKKQVTGSKYSPKK